MIAFLIAFGEGLALALEGVRLNECFYEKNPSKIKINKMIDCEGIFFMKIQKK